jgi:hypothetical protein
VDRRKKSRENREQLRCCNWIRLPNWANSRNHFGGEGGNEAKPGARIFVRSTSFCSGRAVRDVYASHRDAATAKLLRKKKNESWAMRLSVAAIPIAESVDGQRPLHGIQVRLSELEVTCYA